MLLSPNSPECSVIPQDFCKDYVSLIYVKCWNSIWHLILRKCLIMLGVNIIIIILINLLQNFVGLYWACHYHIRIPEISFCNIIV